MIQSSLSFAATAVTTSAAKPVSGSSFSKPEPARTSPPIPAKSASAVSKNVWICIRSFLPHRIEVLHITAQERVFGQKSFRNAPARVGEGRACPALKRDFTEEDRLAPLGFHQIRAPPQPVTKWHFTPDKSSMPPLDAQFGQLHTSSQSMIGSERCCRHTLSPRVWECTTPMQESALVSSPIFGS